MQLRLLGAEHTAPLMEALFDLRESDRGDDGNPYRGLAPFRVEDSPHFFGRDALTEHLVAVVDERARSGGAGPVVVVGTSGAGKNSVPRAGLEAEFVARTR